MRHNKKEGDKMIKETDARFAFFTPEKDVAYLRRAIEVGQEAMRNGNHPFGAILVDLEGNILLEQGNIEVTERVCTGHAETTLMQRASQLYDRDFLWNCTMYTPVEPCCMCCGAAYWGNLGRIVFAATEKDLLEQTGDHEDNPTFSSDCRSILARGQKPMVVQGPVPEVREEALAVHKDYWKK